MFGIDKILWPYHAEIWLFTFNFIIVINSSDLKDPYSNMVAGQATPSGVFDNDEEGKDQDLTDKKHCKSVVAIPDRLDCLRKMWSFVFVVTLDQAKNAAQKWGLCGVKFFAAKYECICNFMLFTTAFFKTISVQEMEPNFLRMKVPELRKYLQVQGISVANKHCEELLGSQTCNQNHKQTGRPDGYFWYFFCAVKSTTVMLHHF